MVVKIQLNLFQANKLCTASPRAVLLQVQAGFGIFALWPALRDLRQLDGGGAGVSGRVDFGLWKNLVDSCGSFPENRRRWGNSLFIQGIMTPRALSALLLDKTNDPRDDQPQMIHLVLEIVQRVWQCASQFSNVHCRSSGAVLPPASVGALHLVWLCHREVSPLMPTSVLLSLSETKLNQDMCLFKGALLGLLERDTRGKTPIYLVFCLFRDKSI